MATTQPTPTESEVPAVELIRVERRILDLVSKADVTLVKSANPPAPIVSMEDFVSRMGNDAATILKYAGVAYLQYFKDGLADNPDVPWQVEDEDGDLTPFTGVPINPEKEKGFRASVIQIAKNLFGYSKNMVPGDAKANREAKAKAKDEAQDFILSNPVTQERLR